MSMSPDEIHQVLTEVFRSLFQKPELVLRDDMTAEDVPGWDSLNHVNLIIQVEEELGVRFRNDEVARLADVGGLKRLIGEKLGP